MSHALVRGSASLLVLGSVALSLSRGLSLSEAVRSEPVSNGGLVTLLARDDLRSSFDFESGSFGARIVEGEISLESTQLLLSGFLEDRLSYGFVHDQLVQVIDLGGGLVTPHARVQDTALKFPVSQFHTLFLDGPHVAYREVGGKVVQLRDANRVFAPITVEGVRHFEPLQGHTYLMRFRSRGPHRANHLVKFQVVDFQPGRTLTLRWGRLG